MYFRKHRRKNKGGCKIPKEKKNKGVFANMSNIERTLLENKAIEDLTNFNVVNVRMIRRYY